MVLPKLNWPLLKPLRAALLAAGLAMLTVHAFGATNPSSLPDRGSVAAQFSGDCGAPACSILEVAGSDVRLIADRSLWPKLPLLRQWVETSAQTVARYYGRFVADAVTLRLQGESGTGISGGRTTNDSELRISIHVGTDITPAALSSDWVLVHEMVHLALPELGRSHDWLAEGLATYVEGIARAQSGTRSAEDVWAEYKRSMPLGLPRAGEQGMDDTPTWGRIYWGGALFCLLADVSIRRQSDHRVGLQQALAAVLRQTGGYASEGDIGEILRIGDAATHTHVLSDLYQQMRAKPVMTDLNALWRDLGVVGGGAALRFDDAAPLAAVRRSITAATPPNR